MHSIHKISCFEEFLHKIALFFKNLFFLDFQSIEPISRLIKIAIKIWFESAWLDRCSIAFGLIEFNF